MEQPPATERHSGRWPVRASIAAMLVGVAMLTAFALSAQHSVVNEAKRADSATQLAAVYQDARFWVGQEESLERKYRLEPSPAVLASHRQAERNVSAYMNRVLALDRSPSTRRAVTGVLHENAEYVQATYWMFAAVVEKNASRVLFFDHWVTEPIFTTIQSRVYAGAAVAVASATRDSSALRRDESESFWASVIAIALGAAFVGLLGLIIRRYRRARSAMQAAELERLGRLVVTDPLTGLRNHRAFDQDLAREIQRTARTGLPLALVMLDVDDLKTVNDTAGHKVGDQLLKTLADTLALSHRATDRAYRIGGDEFALILTDAGEWAALQFVDRLNTTLASRDGQLVRVTAGIAEALDLCGKDDLVHDADLALISARRAGQDVAVYSPDMEPSEASASEPGAGRHTRTLASALALAVDAKDSYTRSHCQTVSTLCAAIANELGFDTQRLARIRLAGLLHDVGKIGTPDAILQKPAKLTPAEYEQMKTHSVLGEGIIRAAELPTEARWVRHHHERIDGGGYPDGLVGREIPLESRIIHVADAFEAMTSDRPYRLAPGERFAVEELRRHAGTQFDHEVVEALVRVVGDSSLSRVLHADEAASPGGLGAIVNA
jgi:diguanylate cyclase (GGDEF)-like protein/putative nucleotidyltransferase with HDIG domain